MRLAALAALFLTACATGYRPAEKPADYSRLIEFIEIDDKLYPLQVFSDFDEQFDQQSHQASLDYLNANPDLILKIKQKLAVRRLRWQLGGVKHRLMFVPESRSEYAALYESYCQDVIEVLLDKTGLDNPYDHIQTLSRSKPAQHEKHDGITAYIVHNLVKEYVGTYIFFNQNNGDKIKIELTGKLYSAEVGAYTSTLTVNEEGVVEFLKDKYTIWQNSAENPYTALMVPAEETLHIALREHTERAIQKAIESKGRRSLKSVQTVVEDWIAVEEAVVGGILYLLLPQILEDYLAELPQSWIAEDRDLKVQYERYRYLKRGISVVANIGYQEAIRLYSADPAAFRALLL